MANTLISSLVSEAVFKVAPDKTSDSTYEARLLVRVHWAFRDIAEIKQPFEFEQLDRNTTLTQSVSAYTKPTDILLMKTLSIDADTVGQRNIDLRPLTLRQYNRMDKIAEGEPAFYLDREEFVYLLPTPNADMAGRTLRYWYTQDPPSYVATQLSPLQPKWDEAVVLGAAAKYLRDDGQFERAKAAEQDYMQALGIRRSKKSNEFGMAGGRSFGLGRSAHGYRGLT